MIKKFIVSGFAMLMSLTSVMAQEETGVGNHLAWGVGFGTEGFNVSIATDMTQYAELEFGVNYAPGFSKTSNGSVFCNPEEGRSRKYIKYGSGNDVTLDVKTSINRATLDFKGSFYPFGEQNDLFIAAGISFASKEIATIKGSCTSNGLSEDVMREDMFIRAGKFLLPIDKKNGELVANGSCQVNSVRPYVGLGYGRLVPKNNLGFRVEAGCQFSGDVKVFHNDKEVELLSKYKIEDDSTPKKFMDFFSIYPVLKVSLRGKFF
ncbi:MAG: hypothetical protein Q4E68_08405 [Prevotellaceae bacterium]|nr:hypothetical protein [Prevotellaceae bacterium]